MKVVNAGIVKGTAQPGVEVSFRGEGSDLISIYLKDDGIAAMTDPEIYRHARQVMTQIIGIEESERAVGGGQPVPLGIVRPGQFVDLGLDSPMPEASVDDIEALRAQVAELRASVKRLAGSLTRTAQAHPLAAVAVVSLGLWALAGLTARGSRRRLI